MEKTLKEQRVKRQSKKSYLIANNKQIWCGVIHLRRPQKIINFGTPQQPLPLYPQTSNFVLNTPHS